MRSLAPSACAPAAWRAPRCEAGGSGGISGPPPPRRTRRVALTVRGVELARYTLPDFFPDLNARDDATEGLEPLEKAADARPYRWQRSVLAGVERSAPRTRSDKAPQQPQDAAQQPQQPPPPLSAEALAPGLGSIALAGLTVIFYAAALALTLARGFVESVPAVMPPT